MKHMRSLNVLLLVFLLLLSGCAQNLRAEDSADMEETDWEEIFPFEDFPSEGGSQTSGSGEVVPERINEAIFKAKFEGDRVSGKGEVVDGVYRFTANKTDGEAWHVKLECNYPTVAGRDYFVTYRFNSNVAGKVKFGDFQEYQIHRGENEITGIMIASGGTSYLDLQLGMLAPFTIDFKEIEVREFEDEVTYENALRTPINFERESLVYEKHDSGYTTILIRRDDTVNINYLSAPLDSGVWKSRLYIDTGIIPEPGERYRITADMMCDEDMPFELLFNNGEEEKGYGAIYDQKLKGNEVKKIEAVVTGNGNVENLVLQLSLGEAPDGSKVIFGNVTVDKIIDNYTNVLPSGFRLDDSTWNGQYINHLIPIAYEEVPIDLSYDSFETVYEQHDEGYDVELKDSYANAFLKINKAPEKAEDRGVWKVRLYANSGVSLEAGKTYLVKYDLVSNVDQADYEACFDGSKENAYGVLYGRSLKAGQTDHVEQWITPESNAGSLKLRLQLGKTDTAKGNRFVLSGFSVEEVKQKYESVLDDFSYETKEGDATYTSVLPEDFSYESNVNVSEEHNNGYTQSLSGENGSATLNIEEAPESDRKVWNSKLLIDTGVTPEPNKKYAVSFDITGEKDQGQFEAVFDGYKEAKYGGLYGQSLTAGEKKTVRHAFVPNEDGGPLRIRLQLGSTDDASGNKITVSNVKVAVVTVEEETVSVLDEEFEYPVVSTITPEGGYVPIDLSDLIYREDHDKTFSQKIEVPSLVIEKVEGVWNSKFYVDTNTRLEEGYKYRITANVTSAKEIGEFEVCYRNADMDYEPGEKAFGALYKQSIAAGQTKNLVYEMENPAGSSGDLTLQFMLGLSPVNTFTVNSVKIEKYIPGHQETVAADYKELDLSIESLTEAHDDGYDQTLKGSSLKINTVPSEGKPWNSKLYVNTSNSLSKDKDYRFTVNVTSEKNIGLFEIDFRNADMEYGPGEKAFGVLYERSIAAGETKEFVFETKAQDEHFEIPLDGKLTVQFQLGKSPAENTFTVNSIKLEEWVPEHTVDVDGAYEEITVADLSRRQDSSDDFTQKVEGTALVIEEVRGLWKSKFYVDTNTRLEEGYKYRITANVTSAKEINFEVDYRNADMDYEPGEKAFGVLYNQSIAAGETKDIVLEMTNAATSSGNLTVQFQLGLSPVNTFTVNSITLERKEESSDPVEVVDKKSFDLWSKDGYKTSLSGADKSASVLFENTPDTHEVWQTKLFALTKTQLKAGKTYRISADVKADQSFGYEICYNNDGEEKGVGAKYELIASAAGETVTFDVTPNTDKLLNIQFSFGNAPTGTKVTVSNIKVEEFTETEGENIMTDPLTIWAPVHKWMDGGYVSSLTNDDSSATLKLDTVSDDPADWKVKLFVETGAKLEKDKEYRISYVLDADKAFDYNVFYNNGTEEKAVGDKYDLKADGSKVEHVVKPGADAELIIQLMVGKSPAGNKITVSDVDVEEIVSGSVEPPVHYWANDGYEVNLANTDSSATANIEKVPASEREPWKVKLFDETGAKLKAGKTYRVSVDVRSDAPMDYEICYNNGAAEKELGGQTGLNASSAKKTVTYLVAPEKDADLTLQFNLGNASGKNSFTFSNLKVEEAITDSKKNLIPNWRYNNTADINAMADEGYKTAFWRDDSSATFRIMRAPDERNPWNAKVTARTGFIPESGKGYRVSVDVTSKAEQKLFEIFYDGKDEMAYGALYEQRLTPGTKTFTHIIYPGDSKGELVLQLRFGKTDEDYGNKYVISNIKVEEVTFDQYNSKDIRNVSELVAQPGYNAELTKYADRDVVRLIRTPKNGREAWKNKLFVNTGTTLKEGEKYRITAVVKSIIPASFEVCLNNGDVEKGLGGIFGLMSRPQGEYISYSAYLKEDVNLAIQLSLGNCVAPNTIVLSDVKVEKAGNIDLVSDKIYCFQ